MLCCTHTMVHIFAPNPGFGLAVKMQKSYQPPSPPTVKRETRHTLHPWYSTQLQGQKYSGISRDTKPQFLPKRSILSQILSISNFVML